MLFFIQEESGIKKVIPSVEGVKEKIIEEKTQLTFYLDKLRDLMVEFTPKVISSLVVLLIGLWLIKRIAILAEKGMIKRDLDVSLRTFLRSLMSIGLKIVLIVTVAGMLGIGTASFVTILGAAGLAVGLALQGSLSNFAGGVLILIFKPFKVGDAVEAMGQSGEVKEIQIFNTILLTGDHKTVILPNGPLSNGTIVNSTRHGNIRVDIEVSVNSSNDIDTVEKVIREVLDANTRILKAPTPGIFFGKVQDGAVIINVKPYCDPSESAAVISGLYHDLKQAFEKNNIKAPVQRRIVETHSSNS